MKAEKMFLCTIDEEDGEFVMLRMAPVDLCALLAVAETLEDCAGRGSDLTALGYSCLAKRIREALGVTADANS